MTNPANEAETFADRLRAAIGAESVNAFAHRAGIGESLLRKYLAGTMPSVDRLVSMAKASGVSIEWLAAGSGSMRATQKPAEIDFGLLKGIVCEVESFLQSGKIELQPEKKAELFAILYEHFQISGGLERKTVEKYLRLVA